MDILKQKRQWLTAGKKAAYKEYRMAKNMQELVTTKAGINYLLGLTNMQKNKEM